MKFFFSTVCLKFRLSTTNQTTQQQTNTPNNRPTNTPPQQTKQCLLWIIGAPSMTQTPSLHLKLTTLEHVSALPMQERWRERASDHARAQQGAQNGTRGSKPSPPSAYAHDSKHQWVSTGKEGKIADWLSSENDCGW